MQQFLNAPVAPGDRLRPGATEGINLIAFSTAGVPQAGDEIIISEMEHHANIVPWQMLCQQMVRC